MAGRLRAIYCVHKSWGYHGMGMRRTEKICIIVYILQMMYHRRPD